MATNLPAAFTRLAWLIQDGHLAQCPLCRGDIDLADLGLGDARKAYQIATAIDEVEAYCPVCAADVSDRVEVEYDYDYDGGRYRDVSTYSVRSLGDVTPLRPGLPADVVAAYAARRATPIAWEIARDDFEGLCTEAPRARLAALTARAEAA